MRPLLVALLTLLGGASLIATFSRADTPVPRAPREGLSYLERAFLPESVPTADELSGMAASPSESIGVGSDPNSYLSGTSFSWTSMSPPDGRSTHTAVYDPLQDRVLVFGGRRIDGAWSLFNDCWDFRTSPKPRWSFLATNGTLPTGRAGPTAVFDPVGNRMLMWGGDDFTSETPPFRQVWALNLSSTPTWVQLSPTGTPPLATFCARAVYDAPARRVLVFGGLYEGNVVSGDVWELSLSPSLAWRKLTPDSVGPSPRYWHTAVYDEQRRRMLVYGGTDGSLVFGEVWSLAITDSTLTWEELSPAGIAPVPRYTHAAVFDASRDRMIVMAGASTTAYLRDSWALELSPEVRWVQLTPGNETLDWRTSPTATLLPGRDSIFVFGGYRYGWPDIYMSDSWFLRITPGQEWWDLAVDGNEPFLFWLGRTDHSAVLDATSRRMIMYGGTGIGGRREDVWALSLSDLDAPPHWTEIFPQGTAPPSRYGHSAIYDPPGRRMIVFGGTYGTVNGAPFSDCWQLSFASSPPTWSKLTFSGDVPPGRYFHAAVFDPTRRWMIVFGGSTKVLANTNYLNDLWVLDLSATPTWTKLNPSGTLPGMRALHSLVLDEKNDRIIVYGGDAPSYGSDYQDTWALTLSDPSHWTQLPPAWGYPAPSRLYHVAAYDNLNDRMLVYGGCANNQIDLWSFSDHPGPSHWTQLFVPGGPPRQRCGRSAVFDQARGAWILYGGAAGAMSNALWKLQWDVPVAVQITFASVRRDEGGVVLEWRTGESSPGTFYVDRELPGQSRERVAGAIPSTSTGYSFRDSSDPPVGTKYHLELLDRAGGTTTFGPYELLDGPGVLGITPMLTATPNPFRSDVKVTARNLPAGDLSIEVCSVAGRVAHRELPIAGFGGGSAEFQIPGLDALPAGLYFVRVRVGATAVTTKVVKIE